MNGASTPSLTPSILCPGRHGGLRDALRNSFTIGPTQEKLKWLTYLFPHSSLTGFSASVIRQPCVTPTWCYGLTLALMFCPLSSCPTLFLAVKRGLVMRLRLYLIMTSGGGTAAEKSLIISQNTFIHPFYFAE